MLSSNIHVLNDGVQWRETSESYILPNLQADMEKPAPEQGENFHCTLSAKLHVNILASYRDRWTDGWREGGGADCSVHPLHLWSVVGLIILYAYAHLAWSALIGCELFQKPVHAASSKMPADICRASCQESCWLISSISWCGYKRFTQPHSWYEYQMNWICWRVESFRRLHPLVRTLWIWS